MKGLQKTYSVMLVCVTTTIHAGIANKVDQWFESMNFDYSSTTRPGVYQGQSARYATLGGYTARAPITQPFDFVNIQLPKFSAGCGGIDIYTGGFSAISSDQLIENLKAIGQNAASLAFMLAIQVVSPQLSGIMEEIQGWANKFNSMGIDSCEAATALVGGALNSLGAKEGNCTVKRMDEFGEDWQTANHACTTGGKVKATEEHGDSPNKVTFERGNLAWMILMQDKFYRQDLELAEVVMNLTGTIILNEGKNGASADIVRVPPAITDYARKDRFFNIYHALLYGKDGKGKLQIQRCAQKGNKTEKGCLALTALTETTPNWQGIYERTTKIIRNIVDHIHHDTPLSDQEKGFIEATSLPIYRYLSTSSAYFPRGTDVAGLPNEYIQLLANDVLLQALQTLIERVERYSGNLKNGLSDTSQVLDFRQDLDAVLNGLALMREKNKINLEMVYQMQERIAAYERALLPKLGKGLIASAQWGRQ